MVSRYDIISVRPGKEKPSYVKVGVMFPAKDGKEGFAIKLDALPLPNEKGEIWINAWVPMEKSDSAVQRKSPSSRQNNDPDDFIPF